MHRFQSVRPIKPRGGARAPSRGPRKLAALVACAALAVACHARAGDANDVLVRVPAAQGADGPLLLLLSGDGDWVAFVRELGEAAAARGAAVLGLKSRSWLSTPRTPEESAALLEGAVRRDLAASGRHDVVIVGYSRGADLAPFVVTRWPADLRERIRSIVLVGPSVRASFEFHLDDLFRDVERPTDLPALPEVERLHGIPLTCVRGADEHASLCDEPVEGMRTVVHSGGHRATAGGGTTEIVLEALGLAR